MTIIDRGKNITYLNDSLLSRMDTEDATRVMEKAKELVGNLPISGANTARKQVLLVGLVQSGKTVALTTAIAMAADNGIRCFIVLTTDNLWLYGQTLERLKEDLPGLEIEGKDAWLSRVGSMAGTIASETNELLLVATKNGTVLERLSRVLDELRASCGGRLPSALIVDDEADQASLDTKARERAVDPSVLPGRVNDLIQQIRDKFGGLHTFLQVTATPQA